MFDTLSKAVEHVLLGMLTVVTFGMSLTACICTVRGLLMVSTAFII